LTAVITTVQVFPDVESQPLQLVKVEPLAAVAVKVTDVPLVYEAEHVLGQVMPAGELVTVPAPLPAGVTVSVKPPAGVGGLERFWGSLGAINWKSFALLSVSWVLPLDPPGFRSYPLFRFDVPRLASTVPSL